jgi:hypothetical protein
MTHRVRPAYACMATTNVVKAAVANLTHNECRIEADYEVGIVQAFDGDAIVYRALQKGEGQPWIVSCFNSQRIHWDNAGDVFEQ